MALALVEADPGQRVGGDGQRGQGRPGHRGIARTGSEIAAAIAFLASPATSYVTGAVLDAHGGYNA
ncbi:hypothetical protein GCM10010310_56600 [Streptomyces violaceolatus]|uniref:SDR family oxidoreductase n=1 Tax=Streptomyces violaceolatus TaxID=67378 RepID=A0ABN3T9F5_9ACTN